MCECIRKLNEKLREHNTVIPPVIFFNGQPSRPEIVVEKLNKSIKGKAMGVMLRFCPFCGEEYAAQQSVHADAGESAASSELVQASALSTSQTVTQPTQRG